MPRNTPRVIIPTVFLSVSLSKDLFFIGLKLFFLADCWATLLTGNLGARQKDAPKKGNALDQRLQGRSEKDTDAVSLVELGLC